jgi:hypothetical protein
MIMSQGTHVFLFNGPTEGLPEDEQVSSRLAPSKLCDVNAVHVKSTDQRKFTLSVIYRNRSEQQQACFIDCDGYPKLKVTFACD